MEPLPVPTFGLEEELFAIDEETGDPVVITDACWRDFRRWMPDTATGEYKASVIELTTPVCTRPRELVEEAAANRAEAASILAKHGCLLLPLATHPSAQARAMPARALPRYQSIEDRKGDAVRQLAVNGVHLHVGTYEADEERLTAIPIVQHVLPLHVAITASSRYFEGRDTQQASWRHRVLAALAPTVATIGVDEAEQTRLTQALRAAGGPADLCEQWGLVRLGAGKPTIEFRAADTTPDLDIWVALSALTGAAAHAVRLKVLPRLDFSPTAAVSLLLNNIDAAATSGTAAKFVDPFDGCVKTVETYARNWIERCTDAIDDLAFGDEVSCLENIIDHGDASSRLKLFLDAVRHAPGVSTFVRDSQPALISQWAMAASHAAPTHLASPAHMPACVTF